MKENQEAKSELFQMIEVHRRKLLRTYDHQSVEATQHAIIGFQTGVAAGIRVLTKVIREHSDQLERLHNYERRLR